MIKINNDGSPKYNLTQQRSPEREKTGVTKKFRDFHWTNNGVFSDDGQLDAATLVLVYTKEEIDELLGILPAPPFNERPITDVSRYYFDLNKADKILPTTPNNVALLNLEGNLKDSGENLLELSLPDVLDGATF